MKLMIADNDRYRRRYLERFAISDPRFALAGLFADLTALYHAVEHRPPDVALVGFGLAVQPEFEVMQVLFRQLSVKWLVVAHAEERQVMHSGGMGKGWPVFTAEAVPEFLARALERQNAASRVPEPLPSKAKAEPASGSRRLFLIGSSTGGVDALLTLLGGFGADCPPTLVVQHTGSGFSAGLAKLLDKNVAPKVLEATQGMEMERGKIVVAPSGEFHMGLDISRGMKCRLSPGQPISGHRPSVDHLFRSAMPFARRVTACILTGMGRDGADQLLRLRQSGARTFGQDEDTSLVYGMPKVAFELGAVEHQLPLKQIAPAMLATAKAS